MNLLLVRAEDVSADGVFTATKEQSEHIECILHARTGDRIKTGILNGGIGEAELIKPSKKTAKLRLIHANMPPPEKKHLRFIIALPRPQSFKKCLHFLASAGIPEACFVQTARVEKSYWNSAAMEPEAIADEIFLGLEQGVDTIPPKLYFYHSLREFRESDFLKTDNEKRLIAHPIHASPCPFHTSDSVCAAIGPEGGFIPSEVEAFENMGFSCVELGRHILRVEFALSYMAGRLIP